MKRISIQDLKTRLSAAVGEAEAGGTIFITRRGEPVAQLCPLTVPHVHPGRLAGPTRLEPALKGGSKGRYLSVLLEDPGER